MLLRFTRLYRLLEADGRGGSTAPGAPGDTGTTNSDGGATSSGTGAANQTQNQSSNPPGAGADTQSNTGEQQQQQSQQSPATLEAALQVIARLDREIGDLRKENASRRVAAKGETPEQKLAREIDETRKRADQAEADLARERLNTRLQASATAAYVIYPDLFALYYAGQVKYNEAGEPTNINDLIAHARKHYPALFKVPSADGGAGGSGATEPEVFGPSRITYAYGQSGKKP